MSSLLISVHYCWTNKHKCTFVCVHVLKDALSERNATTNLDNPEGLLDGLMQAAVCDNVSNAFMLCYATK